MAVFPEISWEIVDIENAGLELSCIKQELEDHTYEEQEQMSGGTDGELGTGSRNSKKPIFRKLILSAVQPRPVVLTALVSNIMN